ncbi:MAG: PEGA domain-containing protein, partial [Ignavibacteria bacterium]|nr:PEGA domain-containing protein [Ignavibacteria bacterium]
MSSKARIIAFTISLGIFLISCERSVFTGYEEPKPENNKLQITSNPSNAKIYLNGKYTGLNTPSLLTWLESGKDTIGLKLFLFRDTTFITENKNEAEQKRYIDFYANRGNYGNIVCVSSPLGASILLNKSKTYNTTPHTFSRIVAGIHSILISKAEHRADSTNVTLAAGQTVHANIVLEDTT